MAEIDTIAKQLIQTYPADFARFALQRDDVEDVRVLNTEQARVQSRHTDSLLRVNLDGQRVLVHHEFQTTDDPTMPRRMAGYIGYLIERYSLPVYAHVLYLRPTAGRRDPGFYRQAHPDYPVGIGYKVIRLSQLDGRAVLDGAYLGLLPFAPLMQPPAGLAADQWLYRCVEQVETAPLTKEAKVQFMVGLTILSGLVYDYPTIETIVPEEVMYESSVVQHFAERALKQGIEQGIEQTLREDVQEALAIRFELAASDPLAARIETIDDVPRLKQLHRAAIQVPSLDAFRHLLDAAE